MNFSGLDARKYPRETHREIRDDRSRLREYGDVETTRSGVLPRAKFPRDRSVEFRPFPSGARTRFKSFRLFG